MKRTKNAVDSDPPILDEGWFAKARPARDVLPAHVLMAAKRLLGRPVGSNKESTTVRFDRDVLDAFRAEGPGWQTRINAALREWLREHPAAR
ncbi:MAG: BrnA antitoxin family protein [Pseudomonadales bacterium]|jgi:uncharacterized protein (DUF4415 family)|nr:BrnA antitoxin family protein [Pseudomonadales bacterium]